MVSTYLCRATSARGEVTREMVVNVLCEYWNLGPRRDSELPLQAQGVQSLVGVLRSQMLYGQAKKNQARLFALQFPSLILAYGIPLCRLTCSFVTKFKKRKLLIRSRWCWRRSPGGQDSAFLFSASEDYS